MSYKATAWAYDLPLKGPAKPVLTALADFADEAGSCFPGQERLCDMTGLSLRTVRRALERLETLGLITRERRFDKFGHRTSDRYYLQIEVQSLPATLTGGHTDLRSESPSLPVTLSIPTGQSDRVTVRRTTSDPSGGREAPYPPLEAVDNPKSLVPWCERHAATEGTSNPCAACAFARERWQLNLVAGSRSDQWAPTKPSKAWKPGMCIPHLQPLHECEMCQREGIA